MRRSSCWVLLLCASCGGIGEREDPNHCRDTYCVGGEETAGYLGFIPPSPRDLLIIVDDRIPSGPAADRLEKALREMMQNTLPLSGWDAENLNVALVSASWEQPAGLWPETTSCTLPSGGFLHSAESCAAPTNVAGQVTDAVACAALHLPVSGGGPRPLETIRTLLAPGGLAETSGFRRKDAYLLVAIVASEDDPGGTEGIAATREVLGSIVEYVDEQVVVGVVAPPTAIALTGLARSFGENGATTDIAADAWSALPFLTHPSCCWDWWPECLDWPLADADTATDGVQPDCVGIETHFQAAGRAEQILPPCPAEGFASGACWRLSWEAGKCPANEFRFLVDVPLPACLPDYRVSYALTCATRMP
jgi:hypothetical protein